MGLVMEQEQVRGLFALFFTPPSTLLEQLPIVQKRCRTRTLDEDDVNTFIRAAVHALALNGYRTDGLAVKLVGGIVSNSYKYPPMGTVLSINGNEVDLDRKPVPRRPGGRGRTLSVFVNGRDVTRRVEC